MNNRRGSSKNSWRYKLDSLSLPGLKRWILIILIGIFTIVFGVLLLLQEHPVRTMILVIEDILQDTAHKLPSKISGIIALAAGGLVTVYAVVKLVLPEHDNASHLTTNGNDPRKSCQNSKTSGRALLSLRRFPGPRDVDLGCRFIVGHVQPPPSMVPHSSLEPLTSSRRLTCDDLSAAPIST